MEYVPGETLSQRVTDFGPPPVGDVEALAAQLAAALAAVHAARGGPPGPDPDDHRLYCLTTCAPSVGAGSEEVRG